jgi:hypothetical protein
MCPFSPAGLSDNTCTTCGLLHRIGWAVNGGGVNPLPSLFAAMIFIPWLAPLEILMGNGIDQAPAVARVKHFPNIFRMAAFPF